MAWNWQQPDWPEFTYDSTILEPQERQFLIDSGEFIGAFRHIGEDDRDTLRIDLISDEALKTSAIEDEVLDRDSVQSSLRQQFGLSVDERRVPPAERGIAQVMVDLYTNFAGPLTHASLFAWHGMLMAGRRDIEIIGGYRAHAAPMQIVSGSLHAPKVHFEAPPSAGMTLEMDAFVGWFNDTAPGGPRPLPPLTRAGIAHLYFESIHPFEDGNGRIGRALSEKSLAQSFGRPSLIALSHTIERSRKAYYDALERNNKNIGITDWLEYFAITVLEAQRTTIKRVDFYVAKAKFYQVLHGQFNERQEKVIARLFRAGIDGFRGGLSAENYMRIAQTSRATATRDLSDLVAKGALTRAGERRHTRYELNIDRAE
jgi:Fic family protein